LLTANDQLDLAVIGGGPAGTSAAITAARSGARVALFESRQFPKHKVCGEFVSAESLDVFRDLLADEAETHRLLDQAPVLARTRLWLGDRVVQAAVSPSALSVPRFELDAALWRAAQAVGVACRDSCEVSAVAGDGPFQLQTKKGVVSARAVILAAGRWSQFIADRALPPGPKWIGLKAHFHEHHPSFTTDLYFFDHGYCGVQPVAAEVINACAMVRADCAGSLPDVFRLHPALRDRSAGWRQVIPTVSTAPLIYREPQPVRSNLMFAGDAAGFIDPFVGDGISIALRSGKLAAECLRTVLAGESTLAEAIAAYDREYSARFAPLLRVAARVRRVVSLPQPARELAFELLRLPGVMPLLIRKTRQAA